MIRGPLTTFEGVQFAGGALVFLVALAVFASGVARPAAWKEKALAGCAGLLFVLLVSLAIGRGLPFTY